MSGVKGRSGTNKDKPWTHALRRAAFQDDKDGIPKLLKIAEACVDAAIAGDMTAIKEIGDRLDGKPAQDTTLTIERRDATDWGLVELVELIRARRAEHGSDRERDLTQGRSTTELDQLHRTYIPEISNGSAS